MKGDILNRYHWRLAMLALLVWLAAPLLQAADPLVFEGAEGLGKGKHLVFLAGDHEYRSEESLPAMARVLAKHHGFKCTVLFNVDPASGEIVAGNSNMPGMQALESADLAVIFLRFQAFPAEQMKYLDAYLNRGGPVVGLRTATHAFKMDATDPYSKYSYDSQGKDYELGFGHQVLGQTWVGHYGRNHQQSTRITIVDEHKSHPILRGVKDVWVQAGGYVGKPIDGDVLTLAQPLNGMAPDSLADASKPPMPSEWTRTYQSASGKVGRVFTTLYGTSEDITNAGYRRMVVNGCLWAIGLEQAIRPDLEISFVGPFRPNTFGGGAYAQRIKPEMYAGFESQIPANNNVRKPERKNKAKPRAAKQNDLSGIQAAMESELANHHAAGVVTLALKNGKPIHTGAFGYADIERREPMRTDSVFWIASMTKSISTTTIMTLVDAGQLSLDEPASKWLPELANVKLADGQPPSRAITLRDLMSHTAGIAFPPRKPTDSVHSLRGYTLELIKAPLAFEPGSNYEYGFGITIAGHIAELVTGKSFEELVQQRILDPLEMRDTSFHPDSALRNRIAKTYRTSDDGRGLSRANNAFVTSEPSDRRMTEPSGGLFSTAQDMAKFYQMVLDGGVYAQRRIVSQRSIWEMCKPHSAGGRELTYGLGWQCSTSSKPAIAGFSTRAFGHGGAFGTHGWIDPEHNLVTVFMVQNALVAQGGNVRSAFHAQVTPVGSSTAK